MAERCGATQNQLHHEGHEEHEGAHMDILTVLRELRVLRGEKKQLNLCV
jgi:hypothetical protein